MTLFKLLFSFALVGSVIASNAQAPVLPVDFETPGLTYFTDFGDASSITGEDPTDPSNTVAITNKPIIAPTWSGTTIGPETGFVALIPITSDETTMSISVYSPDAGIQVRFKIEDSTDPTKSVETEATVTMANTWEVLVFDFANEAPGTAALNLAYNFDKASVFFNFGVDGETAGDKTYYWDNVIMGGEGNSLGQMDLPVTFEDEMVFYTLTDFGGNMSSIVADPVDGSNTVAMSTKPLGSELWAGTTAGNANGFANLIPITATETVMSVSVYSPAVGMPVLLKIEESGNAANSVETLTSTTVANEWETLLFDFTNEAPGTQALNLAFNFDKASIFFNFGTTGDDAGELTFYWDDVQMDDDGITLDQITLPVTFEDEMIVYGPTDFGGNVSEIVADPTDGTNTVAMSVKPLGSELWAGSTMGNDAGFAEVIPITATDTKMSVRVYSPEAGLPIRLKIEESGDPTHSVETEAVTTVANTWETLEFDFVNEAAGTAALNLDYAYDKASIFFNFGTTGDDAGQLTFYWDDVQMVDDGITLDQITMPVTFEDEMVAYGPTDFGGNVSEIVADPIDGTNTVAMTTKPLGAESWAGSTMGTDTGFAEVLPMTATDTKMSVRVYSPVAGVPVRLKIEESGDPTHSVETEAVTTVANTWETLEFDFVNEAAGTAALNLDYAYNMASIFFNFGTTGDDAGEQTYYWDDVEMVVGDNIASHTAISFVAYPNPVVDRLHFTGASQATSIVLMDLMGHKVLGLSPEENTEMNVSTLPAGIYFLRVTIGGMIQTTRVVKQ
jgi:hypothetical protein